MVQLNIKERIIEMKTGNVQPVRELEIRSISLRLGGLWSRVRLVRSRCISEFEHGFFFFLLKFLYLERC